eukprot:1403061-Prymnesium_polylepis.2
MPTAKAQKATRAERDVCTPPHHAIRNHPHALNGRACMRLRHPHLPASPTTHAYSRSRSATLTAWQ